MNDVDSRVRQSLDGWKLSPTPDWDDVLRRARRRRRVPVGTRTALLAGLVLLLAVPALGVGGPLSVLLGRTDQPGLQLSGAVTTANGTRVGSLSLRTSRLFVLDSGRRGARVPHPFAPRGHGLLRRVPVTWALQLSTLARGGEAHLERTAADGRRHVVARLCASCPASATGRLRFGRATLGALFARRVTVVVTTGDTTARGVVRLRGPVR